MRESLSNGSRPAVPDQRGGLDSCRYHLLGGPRHGGRLDPVCGPLMMRIATLPS
jgi:hypothetical protein